MGRNISLCNTTLDLAIDYIAMLANKLRIHRGVIPNYARIPHPRLCCSIYQGSEYYITDSDVICAIQSLQLLQPEFLESLKNIKIKPIRLARYPNYFSIKGTGIRGALTKTAKAIIFGYVLINNQFF